MSKEHSIFRDKFVVMPQSVELVQNLTDAGLYGTVPQIDKFLNSFISKIAGSEKVGEGLVLAWTLSEYDELGQYPPIITSVVRSGFNQVIDTVTPDPEVAQDAKKLWQELQDEAKKEHKDV